MARNLAQQAKVLVKQVQQSELDPLDLTLTSFLHVCFKLHLPSFSLLPFLFLPPSPLSHSTLIVNKIYIKKSEKQRKPSTLADLHGALPIDSLSHLALVCVHVSSGLQVMTPLPLSRKPSLHLTDTFWPTWNSLSESTVFSGITKGTGHGFAVKRRGRCLLRCLFFP